MKSHVFSSWSGGKDACLALYKALEQGHKVDLLFTAFVGSGEHSRAHGLKKEIIEAQAKSLNIPFEIGFANWGEYESILMEFVKRAQAQGITAGIFGDIDLDSHKEWLEEIAKKTDIDVLLPLWKRDRVELVEEFIELGFKTMIISTKTSIMGEEFLGRILDQDLVDEFLKLGIDPSGEGGEFHTVVIDGPIFNEKIDLKIIGKIQRGKYHFLEVEL